MLAPSRKLLSGGLRVDPETKALVARMAQRPSSARIKLIDSTIAALKAAGIWTLFDFVAFPAAHSLQAAMLCWNDERYNLRRWQTGNMPSGNGFVGDRGYVGTAEPICPYSYWTKNVGNKYQPTSNHLAAFTEGVLSGAPPNEMLNVESGRGNRLAVFSDFSYYFTANVFNTNGSTTRGRTATSAPQLTSYRDANSLWAATRRSTASNAEIGFKDGVVTAFTSNSSSYDSTQPSYPILIGSSTAGNANRLSFVSMGGNLSDTQHAQLNAIVRNYLTAIGAPT